MASLASKESIPSPTPLIRNLSNNANKIPAVEMPFDILEYLIQSIGALIFFVCVVVAKEVPVPIIANAIMVNRNTILSVLYSIAGSMGITKMPMPKTPKVNNIVRSGESDLIG